MRLSKPFSAIVAFVGLMGLWNKPAQAEYLKLNPSDEVFNLFGTIAALGLSAPQIVAAAGWRENMLRVDKPTGGGLIATGGGFALLDVLFTMLMPPERKWLGGGILGGPAWSMMGVGIARNVSDEPRHQWLGGSMGFTSWAVVHGFETLGGFGVSPGYNAMQALYGAIGAAGCFIDLSEAKGTEASIAIGCGAVGSVASLVGLFRAVQGDFINWPRWKTRQQAFVPVPWTTPGGGGLSVAGTF